MGLFSSRKSWLRVSLVGWCVAGATTASATNTLQVDPAAAAGGTVFGLQIVLEDPAVSAATDAWVSIGPDKGMLGETSVFGGFLLDVSGLTLAPEGLRFLRFYDTFDASGQRLVFFLEQQSGHWHLGARVWNDTQGQLVLAGKGALPAPCPPPAGPLERPSGLVASESYQCPEAGPTPVVAIEFEWESSSPAGTGRLSVFARPVSSTGAFDQRSERRVAVDSTALFSRSDLDNATQSLSHRQVGVLAAEHPVGTLGILALDEFELRR